MGGSSVDFVDDWEIAEPINQEKESVIAIQEVKKSDDVTTLFLVGKTGNGKSATGNSILGRKAFKSKTSSGAVTSTSELQGVQLPDGRKVKVIDTPGLFDPMVTSDFLGKEIVKCIDLAKDGIHSILLVLSVRSRFTSEEAAALASLQALFGDKILNYVVVVFTGGDDLEDNDETLEDYLDANPTQLKELLSQCNNRVVLFDNKTRLKEKKEGQVNELLKKIDSILSQNGNQPYTNELFRESQARLDKQDHIDSLKGSFTSEEILHFKNAMEKEYTEQLGQLTEMLEEKLNIVTQKLEAQLVVEKSAREKAEESARSSQKRSEQEIKMLQEQLQQQQQQQQEIKMLQEQLQQQQQQQSLFPIIWGQLQEQLQQQQSLFPIIWGRLQEQLREANEATENLKRQMGGNKCSIL